MYCKFNQAEGYSARERARARARARTREQTTEQTREQGRSKATGSKRGHQTKKRHSRVCYACINVYVACIDIPTLFAKRFSVHVCCSVLQCVAVCCSVLQCVVVCCSVSQCVAVCCRRDYIMYQHFL